MKKDISKTGKNKQKEINKNLSKSLKKEKIIKQIGKGNNKTKNSP